MALRILEKEQGPLSLEQLGMPEEVREKFARLIASSHGVFLVTGPTGSGKTTTLYAALRQLQSPDLNIITVEDPVEYDLEGVGQIPVNAKTGMTFDKGLRAILRQDPDVIMVGEIRDLETAQVAVHASLTGHRVFSTLHANDAAGSVTRLVDMGVEPYLAASGLLGAMAQRLARKLCRACRGPYAPGPGERRQLNGELPSALTLYRAVGCEACAYTGYRGRTGVYELMVVDERPPGADPRPPRRTDPAPGGPRRGDARPAGGRYRQGAGRADQPGGSVAGRGRLTWPPSNMSPSPPPAAPGAAC